jgi:microcystin-dependent protein
MAIPSKPTLDNSYTAFQQGQGDNSFPGTDLDNDLSNLKTAIDETIDFTALVIRADGKLQNGVVTVDSLAEDVLMGVKAPRAWITATLYAVDDTVFVSNSLYICTASHTSGVFATDVAANRWRAFATFSPLTELSDNTVSTAKIVNNAVTTAKIADLNITTAKIADASITRAKTAANFGLMPIGATLQWDGIFAPSGWVFKFGQAVSRATYADLFAVTTAAVNGNTTASSATVTGLVVDLRGLGLEGAPIEGPGVPGGTTVSSVTVNTIVMSANATANGTAVQVRILPHGAGDGSTTFNIADDRGRAGVGRDNMGGIAASRVTSSGTGNPGVDASKLGVSGGVDRCTLTAAQTPTLTGSTSSDGAHTHPYNDTQPSGGVGGVSGPNFTAFTTTVIGNLATSSSGAHTHTVTVNSGGGAAHPNMQPSRVVNYIIFTGVV